MNIFVKLHCNKTICIDVDQDTSISDVLLRIEAKSRYYAPTLRLIYAGRQLEVCNKIKDYNIVKESTLFSVLRLCPELYVKWQDSYLMSKEYKIYQNFWGELAKDNVFIGGTGLKENKYTYTSTKNLTIYHLKKVVAKFVCLETHEIALSIPSQPSCFLSNNTLIDSLNSKIYIATLVESSESKK
ncbi:MAG: ubiquitin-like protein [Candidatus Paceibacterota bacterium]